MSPFAKGGLFVCLFVFPSFSSFLGVCVFCDLESSSESGLWRLNLLFSEVFNVFLLFDFWFVTLILFLDFCFLGRGLSLVVISIG